MDALDEAIAAAGSQSALAATCGVVQGAVANWKARGKVPPDYCAVIHLAYGVPRWRFYPKNWHRIWPEIVGAEGAPPVPTGDEPEKAAA
ncbi:MAG: YdaS family helix-turn-helix protein [Burkholderiales bacterium]|jgi:DNA-binding transcriptional regulator YdaS (Cro superfamily)